MIDVDSLKLKAKGRWIDIYNHFGIDVGNGKHKPCPSCGGKDRFRCDNKTGIGEYICGQCGAGDGFSLVQKVTGMAFMDVVEEISKIIGDCNIDKDLPKKPDAKKLLNQVWVSSKKLEGSDPVLKYLHSRKIVVRPDNIRYCPKCYESDTKTEYQAMVAMVQNLDGKPVSLHRTYLKNNKKADILNSKKIMPSVEKLSGSAIRLFKPGDTVFKDSVLGVAEGIETASAASQLFGIATWSVLSTSLMEQFIPPNEYKEIVVFGDNDANFAGQKSAYVLANKLYQKDLLVSVEIPNIVGDWNDVLMGVK